MRVASHHDYSRESVLLWSPFRGSDSVPYSVGKMTLDNKSSISDTLHKGLGSSQFEKLNRCRGGEVFATSLYDVYFVDTSDISNAA